jgi:drug/metabolite transporter (DMT)-like permease
MALTRRRGIGLLLLTTLLWGTTFPANKVATELLSPAQLVSLRFGIAALVLAPWLRRATRATLRDGALTGVLAVLSYFTFVLGITTISGSRAGFLIGLNVVLVPLAMPLLGRPLAGRAIAGALLAAAGLAVLAVQVGSLRLSTGDLWVLASAAAFAAYVLVMDARVHGHDALALSAVQLTTAFALALAWSLGEGAPWPQLSGSTAWVVFYLGIACTAVPTWAQVVGQRVVAPAQAAVIYALEPVFAAACSAVWLGERLGPREWLGGALILGGTVACLAPWPADRTTATAAP